MALAFFTVAPNSVGAEPNLSISLVSSSPLEQEPLYDTLFPDLEKVATTFKSDYENPSAWSFDSPKMIIHHPQGKTIKNLLLEELLSPNKNKEDIYHHLVKSLQNYQKETIAIADITNLVNSLLATLDRQYDWESLKNFAFKPVAANNAAVLEKILLTPPNEATPNLLCMQMNDFLLHLLNDSGIKGVIPFGLLENRVAQINANGGFHVGLLYQIEDSFIWNNYGKSIIFTAPNLTEALRFVAGRSHNFTTLGIIAFQGITPKSTFIKYGLLPETVFGEVIEKNSQTNLEEPLSTSWSYLAKYSKLNPSATTENQHYQKQPSQINLSHSFKKESQLSQVTQERGNPHHQSFTKITFQHGRRETGPTFLADAGIDRAFKLDLDYQQKQHNFRFSFICNETKLSSETIFLKTRNLEIGTVFLRGNYRYLGPDYYFRGVHLKPWVGSLFHGYTTLARTSHNDFHGSFPGADTRFGFNGGILGQLRIHSLALVPVISYGRVADLVFTDLCTLEPGLKTGFLTNYGIKGEINLTDQVHLTGQLQISSFNSPQLFRKKIWDLYLGMVAQNFLEISSLKLAVTAGTAKTSEALNLPSYPRDLEHYQNFKFSAALHGLVNKNISFTTQLSYAATRNYLINANQAEINIDLGIIIKY